MVAMSSSTNVGNQSSWILGIRSLLENSLVKQMPNDAANAISQSFRSHPWPSLGPGLKPCLRTLSCLLGRCFVCRVSLSGRQ